MNSITLTTNTYDGSALTDPTGLTVHDASFATGNLARGNLTRSVSPGAIRNTAYDIGGLAVTTDDGQGHGVTIHVADGTNFSLPGSILPTGPINMQTNFAYNAGWMPASTTGPNGDTGIKTYDSFGRVATRSSFTRVTARRIARPPDADFVARFRSARLPGPTARQLSDLTMNYSSGSFPHW